MNVLTKVGVTAISALNGGVAVGTILWSDPFGWFAKPEPVQAGYSLLGGAKDVLLELVQPVQKIATITSVTVGVVGLTVFVMKRKRVRGKCDEYMMQLREVLGIPPKEVPAPLCKSFVLESKRENSTENTMVRPKCQILVGKVGSNFEVYGSAVRIWDSLVVPDHVLVSAMDDDRRIWFKGAQGMIPLDYNEFMVIDTDIAIANLSSDKFSKIGAPMVSLHEHLPDQGDYVSICGVLGKGTVGKIMHDYTTFGKVVYHGTTLAGYSGAPYMKGNLVVGIHCWGGQINGGYSASYLKTLIQLRNKLKPEDSSDFILKLVSSKKLKKNDIYIIGGSDEVQIRYQGQYHLIDGEDFRKARGFEILQDQYDDSQSTQIGESLRHSGESQSLSLPGDSGSLSQPGDLESLVTSCLTKMLKECSLKQFSNLRKTASAGEQSKQVKTTAGLLSTETQK